VKRNTVRSDVLFNLHPSRGSSHRTWVLKATCLFRKTNLRMIVVRWRLRLELQS
jgi:hypothetical protein